MSVPSRNRGSGPIVFLTRDTDLIKGAVDRLAALEISIRVCREADELGRGGEPLSDWVLVLDARILARDQPISELMDGLGALTLQRPNLICIAPANDLDRRLQALRAGAKSVLVTPLEVDDLVERLLAIAGSDAAGSFRVLVVDDQPVAAAFAARVLEGAGMQTRVVGDALLVLDALTEFEPELVVMDLHMPGASGMELTSLIRGQDELSDIPIVFLSCELDTSVQMDALRVGGNDFLVKPASPERLIGVVRDRVLAARSKRSHRRRSGQSEPRAGLSGVEVGDNATEKSAIGGDGVSTCEPAISLGAGAMDAAEFRRSLEEALGTGGLEVFYQPIVALRRAAGERYEAMLMRRGSDGEYLAADDFLSGVQSGGLTARIDRWVLERSLDELQLNRGEQPGLRLFVPQSMEAIGEEHWLEWLRDQILERDLLKHRPILQFRMSDVIPSPDSAAERFAELRRLGIRSCISQFEDDPVATSMVEDLRISMVRLAASTAEAMETAELKALVQCLRELGCAVIAEGIESPQTLMRVWQCGADFVQGNFLQMPAPDLAFDFSESVLD